MSLERDIKETLGRHAGDVRPSPGAWRGIERRVRRTHRQRMVAGSAAALAVIVGAAIVTPWLFTTKHGGIATSTPEPSESDSGIPLGWSELADDLSGVVVRFPPDWNADRIQGELVVVPPGLKPEPVEVTPGEFRVEVDLQLISYLDNGNPPESFTSELEINGRRAIRYEEGLIVLYWIDWTEAVCDARGSCPSEGPFRLTVFIYSLTPEFKDRYEGVAERIVRAIRIHRSSTAGMVAGWEGASDSDQAWFLKYPSKEWRRSSFEGTTEFHPKDLSPFSKGEPTFGVAVTLRGGHFQGPVTTASRSEATEIDGKRAQRLEYDQPNGGRDVVYRIEWTDVGCPGKRPCRDSESSYLEVRAVGSTKELWQRYGQVVTLLISTIEGSYFLDAGD